MTCNTAGRSGRSPGGADRTGAVTSRRAAPDREEPAVRLRLTPRDTSFYDFFSRAAHNLVEGAAVLRKGLAPGADRAEAAARLKEIEHDSDEITHAVMRQLNSTFVTPFDREDIYALASRIDDVMDHMEAAADLALLYELDELPADVQALAEVLVRAAEVTADAMPRLQGLKGLQDYWIEVNRLENEADQVYRRSVAKLFSGQYEALHALKLKDLIDELEAAADAFEDVADTVETIAVKES
jgi:predicted phosphate transport protein (TIGR00153 family)